MSSAAAAAAALHTFSVHDGGRLSVTEHRQLIIDTFDKATLPQMLPATMRAAQQGLSSTTVTPSATSACGVSSSISGFDTPLFALSATNVGVLALDENASAAAPPHQHNSVNITLLSTGQPTVCVDAVPANKVRN